MSEVTKQEFDALRSYVAQLEQAVVNMTPIQDDGTLARLRNDVDTLVEKVDNSTAANDKKIHAHVEMATSTLSDQQNAVIKAANGKIVEKVKTLHDQHKEEVQQEVGRSLFSIEKDMAEVKQQAALSVTTAEYLLAGAFQEYGG